jgi:hypothetical protein
MSTILFHSSPLVAQLGLHNGGSRTENGQNSIAATGQENARPMIPDVPRVMLRPAPDRRRRTHDIQRSA